MEYQSSPARGTWIEIHGKRSTAAAGRVVPRKGDVDRNQHQSRARCLFNGRPPQGGRG